MIKLAIVGCRKYTNYENFKTIINNYIEEIGFIPDEIISGGARGVDSMAEIFAKENNIPITIFHPDWNKYGKSAGILRNTDIINSATHVIALPSVHSKGTYDSINKAKKLGKNLKVVNI